MKMIQISVVRIPFATILFLALITGLLVTTAGCGGGTTMDEMRRRAIRRPKEDSDEDAKPLAQEVAATPVAEVNESNVPSVTPIQVPNSPRDGKQSALIQKPLIQEPVNTNQQVSSGKVSHDQTLARPETAKQVEAYADVNAKPPQTLGERRQMTIDNMRQISSAIVQYVAERNVLPGQATLDSSKQPLLSWRVSILPQLGLRNLYDEFHHDEPWDSPHNQALLGKIPRVFQSPERLDTNTNYQVPIAASSLFPPRRVVAKRRVEDGLAVTAMLLEVDDSAAVPWTKPADHRIDPRNLNNSLGQLRQDGFFVAWGDGKVMVCIKNSVGMYTIDGGERIDRNLICEPPVSDLAAVAPAPGNVAEKNQNDTVLVDHLANAESVVRSNSKLDVEPTSEYLSQARTAWSEKRERDARHLQLMAIVSGEVKRGDAEFMRWSDSMQRSVPLIHWGIAIHYSGPRVSDPMPIRGNNLERSEGQEIPGLVGLATGELGTRSVALLKRHLSLGTFGRIPQDATLSEVSQVDNHRRRAPDEGSKIRQPISPGLIFVAAAKPATLLKIARQDQLDALLRFDITCKLLDGKNVHNTTTIRVVDVHSGVTLFTTKPLNNIRVAQERSNPIKEDPVEIEFQRLDEYFATKLALKKEPPTLTAEEAKSRIARLDSERLADPIAELARTEFYYQYGLLTAKELLQARTHLVGEDAAISISMGSPDEKRGVVLSIERGAKREE